VDEQAAEAARVLSDAGFDVLLDDRDLRAGEKFADADLIGLPVRVTVGKKTLEDGCVDMRVRATREERRVIVANLGKEIG
jgi:prolyl-tRNA synthetase